MQNTDDYAEQALREAMQSVDLHYKQRGIFQDRFGFGKRPAVVVVDFACGWTDDRYAGGSKRLDRPIEYTRQLLELTQPVRIAPTAAISHSNPPPTSHPPIANGMNEPARSTSESRLSRRTLLLKKKMPARFSVRI